MMRYALTLALFFAAAGIPSWYPRSGPGQIPEAAADSPDVPEAVRRAAAQGRFWRASRLLEDHLETVADTTPPTVLLASRLSAGWGDWSTVSRLLEGRAWLDEVERGAGWELVGRSRIELGRLEAGSEALARYLRVRAPGDLDRGIAELRRGIALGRAGETGAALEAFDAAEIALPWFGDWAAFMAAQAAAAAGDTAEVRRRLADAGGAAGDRRWRIRLEAAREAGDRLAAREVALAAAGSLSSAGDRAEAWVELGRLRLQAGDTIRARQAFRRAMESRSAAAAVTAARTLTELGPTPEDWRAIGSIYRWHGNPSRAIEAFESYLASNDGGEAERARARLELGRARYDAGRFRDAERELLALAGDAVPAGTAAEALYWAARAQYRQGRSEDGQRTFVRLAERFPREDAVTRGLYLLADLKHDDLAIDEARLYYRRAADAVPAANEAGLSLMRLGGLAYLERDYGAAADIYEEYRRLHPDGRRAAQATYWAARSYAALGRDSLAAARLRELRRADPLSYYGVRAAARLGEQVLDLPMRAAPARDTVVESSVATGLRRVDVLAELDRRTDLVHEVERLRAHFSRRDGGDYALAEALNERGYTLTGIGMGWEIFRAEGEWNPRLLRIIYPFPFRRLVVPEARERRVDPYLVAGLIRRESAFSPVVVSSAGAIGLMQIMPQTGRGLARGAGLQGFRPELLKQPEINVHLGTRYFESLFGRFDGHLPLVLSAYNAGPNRARRWRELPEAVDPELFTERIPYGETRDYVRHVLLHRAIYAALYPDLELDTDERGAGPLDTPADRGAAP